MIGQDRRSAGLCALADYAHERHEREKMGYVGTKIYDLVFDTDPAPRVRAFGLNIQEAVEFADFVDLKMVTFMAPEDSERRERLFELIGSRLVDWDMEDHQGQPIPASPKGMRLLDVPVGWLVAEAWLATVTKVPAFLAQPSRDGDTSQVASLPMEPLSESP